MSRSALLTHFAELLASRWEVPLAVIALAVGAGTVTHLVRSRPELDIEGVMARAAALRETGDPVAAADELDRFLAFGDALPAAQRADLHERLAALIFDYEQAQPEHNPSNAKKLVAHAESAIRLGRTPPPGARIRVAQAQLWAGQSDEAARELRALLGEDLAAGERREALRLLAPLLGDEAGPEHRQLLGELLADESLPTADAWWALRDLVQGALDEGDTAAARELLETYGDRLRTTDVKGYLEYLTASLLVHEGRLEEAEPLVHWVQDWIGSTVRLTRDNTEASRLRSLSRVLLGEIHLARGRADEALEEFDHALPWPPAADLLVTVAAGRGRALAALNRHEEARAAFEETLKDLLGEPAAYRKALRRFRAALAQLFESCVAAGDFAQGVPYLELATTLADDRPAEEQSGLLERLGDACVSAADQVAQAETARDYHRRAGLALEKSATAVELDEPRRAALLWGAGQSFAQAGEWAGVQRVLTRFVAGPQDDPRIPEALLLIGQACEMLGDNPGACARYSEVIARYPQLEVAARARVRCAGAHAALGPEHYGRAEELLLDLLSDDRVSPDAAAYREGLLALCELLYHQERYGEAIGRLENFLALYGDDPARLHARLMLANAYRRSAAVLRESPPPGSAAAAQSESRDRYRRAAGLYESLRAELAAGPATEERALYARTCELYAADCLFELNDAESLRAALAAYRAAAARYENEPAALVAQVQIVNAHLRLGSPVEAAQALERARWLLRALPDAAFDGEGVNDRAHWERLLAAAATSDLFRDALAAAR